MNRHIAPPEFAMSFTPEAVLLEHRDGLGWRPLGQAQFAGREMTARLAALRDGAGTVPGDLDTVLVIPDDQILYTTLTVPVGSDTPVAIARALEAMTPYPASDLAFDWCPSETGDIETLRVAAVARRTLEEAEDFARTQGFRPSGFVARPDDARFEGQPDFGPSRLAEGHFTRQPFSEPDLTQTRVTDPVVAESVAVVQAPVAPATAAPVVSRIVPHVVLPAVQAKSAPWPQPAPAEAAAEAAAPAAPVAGVIRHGEPKAPAAPRALPPRAQAVHDRARQARATRATPGEDEDMPAAALLDRLRRLDPGRLPVMMGLLALGLVVVLAFFGGSPSEEAVAPAEVADTAPAPQPLETAPETDIAAAAPEAVVPETMAAETAEAPAAVEPLAEAASPATMPQPEDTQPVQPTLATPVPAPAPPAPQTATAEATPPAPAPAQVQQDAATANAVSGARPVPAPAQAQAEPAAPVAQGDDRLSQALTEALNNRAQAAPQTPISAATMASDLEKAPRPTAPATGKPASPAPAARAQAPAATPHAAAPARQLASSARPPRVAPVRASAPARTDTRPAVPANPRPFTESARTEPSRQTAARPPERPAAAAPARSPAAVPAAARPSQPANGTARPPARPQRQGSLEEGSRAEDGQPTRLTQAERRALTELLRDLRTAQAGASGLSQAERGALVRLADARPTRKPVAVNAPSQRAVRDAVAAAVADSDRPETRAASRPAASAGKLGRSARPAARPGGSRTAVRSDPGPGNPSLSSGAIDQAVAAAVSESPSPRGAVALTALRSSALPPRRTGRATTAATATVTAAAAPVASLAPTLGDLRSAAQAQSEEAARAEQRRQDAELQAQAEARARARAAQDAQAEAQARAQAEARARAQAEAEARAAAARQQRYAPPEAEDEPEVAANIPDGRTPTTAGTAATVKDGIQINRTQIIGTIGAGKASRALVRLSNGRVLTLRLGDKINGGTITDIGDSRITFVKGGQQQALSVLGGR